MSVGDAGPYRSVWHWFIYGSWTGWHPEWMGLAQGEGMGVCRACKSIDWKHCLYGNLYCHFLFAIVCILEISWLQEMVHSNCGLEMFMCTLLHSTMVLCLVSWICPFIGYPLLLPYWCLCSFSWVQMQSYLFHWLFAKPVLVLRKFPFIRLVLTPCSPVLLVLLIHCYMGCAGFDTQLL